MRTGAVWVGMLLEALAISITVPALILSRPSFLPQALSLLLAQGIIIYAVHCLSHYLVGRLVGIRFSELVVGRSALRNSGSRIVRLVGERAVTPVLIVDRVSLAKVGASRRKAMFYAGVTSSTATPFLVALYAALRMDMLATLVTFIFAVGYLTFNIFYSPKTGDIYRARLLVAHSPQDGK